MANLHDYLELRGDITLAERPFNDVDNLALSTLAYLDLTDVVGGPGEPPVRVTDACAALLARSGGDVSSRVRSLATIDERFVAALGGSARLGGALLRDYVDVRDDARAMQFAAVTVELGSGELYVAFRGTDTTLAGWRENFILSFAVTEAQRAAAAYLERALARAADEGRRVRVGGHSKGGNLAAYATAAAPVAYAGAIERVYSNDGPGMDPAVMPVSCHDVVGERYVRIIPAYSVVGRCFSDDAPAQVVASSASRSLQQFLEIAAYIGVNLAVFNLLPIPSLDGSKVIFTCIEWVRGKPVNRKAEAAIHFAGLILLLAFAVLVDVLQWV